MRRRTGRKRRQLKWNMILILTFGWFLPLTLLSAAVLIFAESNISRQMENTIVTSADKAVEICQMRINEAIDASKASSYLPAIRDSYEAYQSDGNFTQFKSDISLFMSQQYRYNPDVNMTALYFADEPESIYYCYNNNNSGGTYEAVRAFKNNAAGPVREKAAELDTDTAFLNVGGRIYLIRNMVDSRFQVYGTIVMELNMSYIFEGLDSVWAFRDAEVFVDGAPMLQVFDEDPYAELFPERIMKHSACDSGGTEPYVYKVTESSRHRFAYLVLLDPAAIRSEMNTVKYVFLLLLGFMIPLIVVVFFFFHSRVNVPIRELRNACREIEKEHYGYQLSLQNENEEFYELGNAFNSMSGKLKYQFEKIYLEELALRDANIKALQSQINPHFLNNTLEIINWEARMAGNYKMSGMIEALSTMLEATMNRKREELIPLSEELSYVESYLFIISQRYGDHFQVKKEIDESLMDVKVPRLIIQPIIENAVEHGMDLRRRGQVWLTVRREGGSMCIEIRDNGKLTREDAEKIHALLETDSAAATASLELGIRNVNRRLKIIYGDGYGLTIKSDKEGYTISTITVKIDKENGQ